MVRSTRALISHYEIPEWVAFATDRAGSCRRDAFHDTHVVGFTPFSGRFASGWVGWDSRPDRHYDEIRRLDIGHVRRR